MSDIFGNSSAGRLGPSEYFAAVTPDDSADLAQPTKAVFVGTAGDVRLRSFHGANDVTFKALAGHVLPVKAVRVLATGTTATDIVALF